MAELEIIQIPLMEVAEVLDPSQPRSEGNHITELIQLHNKAAGKRYYDDSSSPSPEVLDIMAFGRIWEWALRGYLTHKAPEWGFDGIIFSFETERDGIYGSLDGLFVGQDNAVVDETKARFTGPNDNFPLGHHQYPMQIKSYCKMVGTTRACMPVLHVESKPPRAQFYVYWIEFSQLEIDENWQLLLNRRDYEGSK